MKLGSVLSFVAIAFAVSGALSFLHPWGNPRAVNPAGSEVLSGSNISPDVRRLIETRCADCHSNNTHWPVYSRLSPASWLVERDVQRGRASLNLSNWQQYTPTSQIELLTRIGSEVRTGEMPPRQYLILHHGARLNQSQQDLIYAWARAERKRIKQEAAQQMNGGTQ
jgi:cytochrome c